MNARQSTGIAVLALLACQAAAPVPSHAQQPSAASPAELVSEYARQDEIYRSKGREIPRGYVIDRSLEGYAVMLPDAFDRALESLGEQDRWLDIGAGQGRAILDYYAPHYDKKHRESRKRRANKARSVALSIEDRRTAEWHKSAAALEAGKLQYRHGKRLREYSPEELGHFKLITDVMGGFSYAADLSLFMQRVMQLLEVDGSFFTVLQDVEVEDASNKPWYEGYPFATEIADPAGAKVPMCAWLKSIACAEVRCEARPDRRPPREVYQVRKVCSQVAVPPLVPVDFQAGTPPQRGYVLGSPASGLFAPSGRRDPPEAGSRK